MEGIVVARDIAYAGTEQRLIIAYPSEREKPRPAVLHFHGGGWRQGTASEERAVGLAQQGFVGLSVNYRLSGEARFPAAVHDAKAAIRWLRAHAAAYGVDAERIGVVGESAGGHLAALIGTSAGDAYLEGDGPHAAFSSRVQVVVDHFGPTDFLRMNDVPGHIDHDAPDSPESAFIGGPIQRHSELVRRANPIAYVQAQAPPILMVHGREDRAVPFNQSELFYKALQKAGVPSRLVPVERAGHGYAPHPAGATPDPSRGEIAALEIEWLLQFLCSKLTDGSQY